MPDFDWKDYHQDRNWHERFGGDAVFERGLWEQAVERPGRFDKTMEQTSLPDWESMIPFQLGSRPRVFISHRHDDEDRAMEIARLAKKEQFDYWLDVWDPTLQTAMGDDLPDDRKAVVIATIIEMALLNCSHVIALITKNSYGSRWIPYEYGRVKIGTIWSQQACCWIDSSDKGRDFRENADYLELGHQTTTDGEIRKWFQGEKSKWPPKVPPPWPGGRRP